VITIEMPCWHEGCLHIFSLAFEPEDASANNVAIIAHLFTEHDSAGLVCA
jgi:hypothetical protein